MRKDRLAILCLSISTASTLPSYVGLLEENQLLSVLGLALFILPVFFLFGILYHGRRTGKYSQFWFGRLICSIGDFKLLSKVGFEIEPYVEGSILCSLFLIILFIYGHSISGAFSYMFTSPSTILFFGGFALIMGSMVNYNERFRRIEVVMGLCMDRETQRCLRNMHEKYVSYINGKLSVLFFLIGAIGNGIGFLLISNVDKLFARMTFYVKQGYVGSSSIYVLEPPDVLGVLSQQIGISLIAGCLAMSALMIYVTLSLLTRLDSESALSGMVLNPYNASPLRRVTELLTSFWVI